MTVAHSHTSTRMRLSLQTLFQPIHLPRPTKSRSHSTTTAATPTTSPSSLRSSPSSTFSLPRHIRPQMPPNTPISPNISSAITYGNLRRQLSTIDLALEEEAHSPAAEVLGLGLLEPRPRANTGSSTSSGASSSMSWMEFMAESEKREVVLDGIMEVLERA